MHQVFDEIELLSRSLILRIKLDSLLKLMLCAFVLACGSQNEPPNDPALSIERLLLDTFSDFLDGFDDIAFFEFREGPVHVCIMTGSVELFGLTAYV